MPETSLTNGVRMWTGGTLFSRDDPDCLAPCLIWVSAGEEPLLLIGCPIRGNHPTPVRMFRLIKPGVLETDRISDMKGGG